MMCVSPTPSNVYDDSVSVTKCELEVPCTRRRAIHIDVFTIVREYVFYVFFQNQKNATYYVFWSVMSKNVKT